MSTAGATAAGSTPPAVVELVRRLAQDLDGLTDRLVAAILAEDPTYAASDRTPPADLRTSCRGNLQRLLCQLTGDLDRDVDPHDAPRATGARRAEQGMPLESVLHAYRLGYRTIWEGLVEQARSDPQQAGVEALVDAATVVWEVVDRFSAAVAGSYRETEARLARRDDRRRDAALDALLSGRGADRAVLAEAASTLDLPERGPTAVVVVAAGSTGGDTAPVRAALAVRGVRVAWRERAETDVGVVALRGDSCADLIGALQAVGTVRAAVSPVVDGLAEAGSALGLATTALRALPPGATGVAELDARLPAALLVTAPDLARRLLQRTLGPVLALEEGERDLLLDTLRTWMTTGGSAGQSAERLYCHRNTVLNRLRRIEALTGRSSDRVDDLVAWSLALTALDLLAP